MITNKNILMTKINTFEEFLQDKFNDLREVGGMPITKDNCEDMIDVWLQYLDVQELIDLGEKYGKYVAHETLSNLGDEINVKIIKAHNELENE